MPSGASRKSAWRPRLPSWAPLTLGLLTACLPVAQASSRAGLGLHLGYHPGPGHQTHLNKTEEVVRHQFPWARPSVFPSVPCATAQGAVGDSRLYSAGEKGSPQPTRAHTTMPYMETVQGTHLGQHRPCLGLSAASAAVVLLAHGPWRPPPAPCR